MGRLRYWLIVGGLIAVVGAQRAWSAQPAAPQVGPIESRLNDLRAELGRLEPAQRQRQAWRLFGAERLLAEGRPAEALQVANGVKLAGWSILVAGDLTAIVEQSGAKSGAVLGSPEAGGGGLRLVGLYDSSARQPLSPPQPLPLFVITLRHAPNKQELKVSADAGWKQSFVAVSPDVAKAELRWRDRHEAALSGLEVVATVQLDAQASQFDWRLSVEKAPAPWALWRVVFPQVALPELGPDGRLFFPKAAGEVQADVWGKPFRFGGTYPSGWTTMQFLAGYNAQSGLYVGVHDPWGSTKDIVAESRPAEKVVALWFDHPVADMGVPGNRFQTRSVWRVLRGDWFDAAMIYRQWVRREARWFPKLGAEGREDTPLWMRQLAVWALGGGPPAGFVPQLKHFAGYLGTPVAVHWYNWHQIPFDNDYPHYFPTHPGFAEAVTQLQNEGVFVMPYINGRLWDTRDRGMEDFQFTAVARPAVSKNENLEPYTETYGSKESDGSPVRLGVMCPATELWQNRVRQTVLRLFTECGVKGVYIDQVAAAAPTLCFDPTHGHPRGGGHWWTEGYWKLLESIRNQKPADCMITTECNGEPYVHLFDGYLTWHWQYDGQVPAFPAVYGGAVQMFGRSYGGGPTRDLALRMRAGQQLVFGEQLGWINPGVVNEKGNAEFFRQLVRLRRALARYFYAGEMARPPRLVGAIPTVKADWQWHGVRWVTTDAVLAGAWHQPAAGKLVLMFVNVSDDPVGATVEYDLAAYGFKQEVRLREVTEEGPGGESTVPCPLRRAATFPARRAIAWEITAR